MPRKIIEGNCPDCNEELVMRLPSFMDTGTFTLDCPGCEREIVIDSIRGEDQKVEVRMNGKMISTPRAPPLKTIKKEKPPSRLIAKEIDMDMELPYHNRLRIVFVLLMIVGVLGVFSSFSTIAGSFSINDLETKSPNNLVTLSVWIIDAESGRPINDVDVIIIDGETNFTARSNMEGLAVISDLVAGKMDLVVTKEGYNTVKSDITIKKGSPNVIDIPMEKGNEEEVTPILVHQFEPKSYSPLITNIAASLMLLASVLAFTGAVFVYRKEFFLLTLVASFLSIFSFGFLLGSILALVSLVLIILSYDGFTHTHMLKKMLERVRSGDLRYMLNPDQRDLVGLPPVRER